MNFEIINNYIFTKHYIVPGTQICSIEDVSRTHLGLHSARLETPYTTLCSRLKEYNTNMLQDRLYINKTLIKLRCMRTTLHIVSKDIASMLHNATLDIRLADCLNYLNRNNIPIEEIDELSNYLIMEIAEKEMFPKEIEEIIYSRIKKNKNKQTAKRILKYFWEKGILCYINIANDWEKENRKYALTKYYYPDIDLRCKNVDNAQEQLIIEYLKMYGPVTIKDAAWWSGLNIGIVKKIIGKNYSIIKHFVVENLDYFMLEDDYLKLINFNKFDFDWVALLAYEDPSLKGYYESRGRYIDNRYYNELFNQIGEVRSSIIYNGKSIGTWICDKKKKCIQLKYFTKINKKTGKAINQQKEKYEAILFPSCQLKLFV